MVKLALWYTGFSFLGETILGWAFFAFAAIGDANPEKTWRREGDNGWGETASGLPVFVQVPYLSWFLIEIVFCGTGLFACLILGMGAMGERLILREAMEAGVNEERFAESFQFSGRYCCPLRILFGCKMGVLAIAWESIFLWIGFFLTVWVCIESFFQKNEVLSFRWGECGERHRESSEVGYAVSLKVEPIAYPFSFYPPLITLVLVILHGD